MSEELRDKYRDELMKKSREKINLINEIKSLDEELKVINELYCEHSGDYTKVMCPFCNGMGYTTEENGDKVKCQGCNGKLFMWMQTFKEEVKDGKNN